MKTSKIMVRLFAVIMAVMAIVAFSTLAFAEGEAAEVIETETIELEPCISFDNSTSETLGFESNGYIITVKNYTRYSVKGLVLKVKVGDATDAIEVATIEGLGKATYNLTDNFAMEYLENNAITVTATRNCTVII